MEVSVPRFFVHKKNQETYNSLYWIKNTDGKKALTEHHRKILEYIASFDPENGCFASNKTINSKTCQTSYKTFLRNLSYLLSISAININFNENIRILRISIPKDKVVKPQRLFRFEKGIGSYLYINKDQNNSKNEEIFLKNQDENCSEKSSLDKELFSQDREHFAAYRVYKTELEQKNEKEKKLPLNPLRPAESDQIVDFDTGFESPVPQSVGSLRDPNGLTNNRQPISESLDGFHFSAENFSNFNNKKDDNKDDLNEDISEPLAGKKTKSKEPKNDRERRAEAVRLSNAGHIVGPMGKTNNRKREHNWKLSKDIGDTGAVTNAQLWRHLVKLWDNAFGSGIIENMLSHDKSALNVTFSELKQQFINICKYEPENRDLAEYFEWFLEPKRLNTILASAKYSGPKGLIHFRQLSGAVYIKRFYDETIAKRLAKQGPVSLVKPSRADEVASLVDKMFTEFNDTYDNDYKFTTKIAGNGFALAAQWMHDEKNMTESECRQRIIDLMIKFLKDAPEPEKALEYLMNAEITTEEHAPLLKEMCIWYNWKEKTKDLIPIAIEQSGLDLKYKREE